MSRPIGTNQETLNELIVMRVEMGLTQEQLAEKMGVSAWTISRYEVGKSKLTPMYRLALEHIYNIWLNGCEKV